MRPALRAKGGISKDQLSNHRITTQDLHGAPLLVGRRHPTATSVRLAALSHRANASSPPLHPPCGWLMQVTRTKKG